MPSVLSPHQAEKTLEQRFDAHIAMFTRQLQESLNQTAAEILSAKQARLEGLALHLHRVIQQQRYFASLPKQPCPACSLGLGRDIHKIAARLGRLEQTIEAGRHIGKNTRDGASQTSRSTCGRDADWLHGDGLGELAYLEPCLATSARTSETPVEQS